MQLPFKCYSKPAEVKQHGDRKLGSTQQTNIQPRASVKYKLTYQHFTFYFKVVFLPYLIRITFKNNPSFGVTYKSFLFISMDLKVCS